MFRKSIKKITGIFSAAIIMAAVCGNTVTVHADTEDKPYTINVETSAGSFKQTGSYQKENSTKVYVKISTSPTRYTQVRTYGNRNTSQFYNETKGTTATVEQGVPSSITNYIYENRNKAYTYVLAKVGFRSSSSVIPGTVIGVWSPDSTRNYTIVN